MLDINYIRENSDEIKEVVRKRGLDPAVSDVDRLLIIDDQRRQLIQSVEQKRAEQNKVSEQISKQRDDRLIEQATQLKQEIQTEQSQLDKILAEWNQLMLVMPNRAHPEMVEGTDEADNKELNAWIPETGYVDQEQLGFGYHSGQYMPGRPFHADETVEKPQHHLDLGVTLDLIDTEQSARVSGSRFAYLKNEAVLLQYGLIELLKNKLLVEGFTPIIPPIMVRERALLGTSHFPLGKDQVYKIESEFVEEENELYLVGSSEPPLFAYYMDKVIPEDSLPKKMFAVTTCFRTEVGSWGKDVRGIKRVHQFDKLEMDVVAHPNQSQVIMDELLAINEWFLQQLELPYQVVEKCYGDAGYLASHRQWDVNVWLSGQQEFVETMSNTNAADFQARRLNIRFRNKQGALQFAHTVNDTGAALGRIIMAILDNYQQTDGSVKIPKVLREYVGKNKIEVKS